MLSAVRDCTRSIELKPGDAKVIYARAIAYDGIGDSWNSLQDLNSVLRLTPDDTVAIGQRALTHLKMYEYDLAIADMTRILQLKPGDPAALFQRSIVYEKLNKRDLSKADIEKLAQLLPNDSRIKSQATFLDSLSRPTSFPILSLESDLNAVASARPEFNEFKQQMVIHRSKQLMTEADCTNAVKLIAMTYDKDSPIEAAFIRDSRRRDYYNLVGTCIYRFPSSLYLNAAAYDLTTAKDRVQQVYEGSLLQRYYADRSTLVMKTLLANSGNYAPALKFALLNTLELSYMTTENFPRSVELADQIAKLGPEFADASYRIRWRAQRGLKKYDLAMADLNRLIALKDEGKTRLWIKHYLRAEILNDANRPVEAIKAADAALVKEPEEWQATMQKSRALRLQKKYPEALTEIEKIFAKFPNAMYIRGERALIYRAMGDLQKAYADEAIATKNLQSD
jgi:regulator of sirC expression with transglutaminase-like and TPR domain